MRANAESVGEREIEVRVRVTEEFARDVEPAVLRSALGGICAQAIEELLKEESEHG